MSYPSKTEFDNLRNSLPLTYQTRGNYAFRTDLARNINTALTNVNTALAYYAKKTDIPVVPTNVVTKTDLAGYALRSEIPVVPSNVASKSDLASYALASDLTKYQPAGRYVSPSELEAYQPKGDYAVTKDLVSYAKSSDLASYQPKGDYALASNLANYQLKGDYQPKGEYALAKDLDSYAKSSDLADAYQTKGSYALAKDLDSYAKSSDLANYQPTGNYALKTDLVNYTNKATANVFAAQQTFNGGIILAENSTSNLQGKVNIPNATVGNLNVSGNATIGNATIGNLNVTNIKAASIDGYAKTSDLANYQLKGEYATKSDLDSKTSDLTSYAKTSDLTSYAKTTDVANTYQTKGSYASTAAANTFTAQQTFDGGIILAANSSSNLQGKVNIPNATIGNLNVTGNTLQLGRATFIVGGDKGDDWVRMHSENGKPYNYGLAAKNFWTDGDLYVKGAATVGNLNVTGNLNANGYVKTIDLAPYAKTTDLTSYAKTAAANTFTGSQTFNAANTFNAQQTFSGNAIVKTGPNTPFKVEGDGGLKVDGNATVGNLNVTNIKAVSIDGYAKTIDLASYAKTDDLTSYAKTAAANTFTGSQTFNAANTFNAQQTFQQNAIVKTGPNTPFKVEGDGGLKVSGNTLQLGGATFKVGGDSGTDGWVRMDNNGLSAKQIWTGDIWTGGVIRGERPAGETGLDLATKNNSAEMRIIRNSVAGGDKTVHLGFGSDGGKIKMYSGNNIGTMVVEDGNVNVSGNQTVNSQHVRNNSNISNQGLHFQWNRSGSEGESWIINQQGEGADTNAGIRFGKSDLKNKVTELGKFTNNGDLHVNGIINAPNGINFVHGGSKISDRNGNLHLDTDDLVVFPKGQIKIGNWVIRDEGANLVLYKDGKGVYVRGDGWGIVRTQDWKSAAF